MVAETRNLDTSLSAGLVNGVGAIDLEKANYYKQPR
jgi:hypothetical protein